MKFAAALFDHISHQPELPEIDQSRVVRHDGDLTGEIAVGEVLAWEPDVPHARCFLKVTRFSRVRGLGEPLIKAVPCDADGAPTGEAEVGNPESIFRSACYRTTPPARRAE